MGSYKLRVGSVLRSAAGFIGAGVLIGVFYGPWEFSLRGLLAAGVAGLTFVAVLLGTGRLVGGVGAWAGLALGATAGALAGAAWTVVAGAASDWLVGAGFGAAIATLGLLIEARMFRRAGEPKAAA